MSYGRRHTGLRYLPPFALTLCVVSALMLVSALGAAAFETEVVSPRMYPMATPGGGVQLVPDLAVAGRVIVQLAPGTTLDDLQRRLDANKCTLIEVINNTSLVVVGLPDGMSVVEGRDLWTREAVAALAAPDYLKYPTAVPNDPLYDQQWQWDRIAAPAGWDIETGAGTTVVAVCDTGYDPDHPDLVDKYWVNQAELAGTADTDDDGNGFVDDIYGWDFVDDDNDPDAGPQQGDTYLPDSVRHGTHCAGAVGATTDNDLGVAGHDWACQLMMLRVLGFDGGTDASVIGGIQYAIDNGADVISLSIGGGYSPIYDPVFANANAAGIVVVAAAGNEYWTFTDDPSTWLSPVCNDGPNLGVDNFVLGVGASDEADIVGDFSNRDASSYNFVDVIAPGVDTFSTYYSNPAFADLVPEYGLMTGTSMACPIAAGLAALVKGHFPGYSADDIINQIRDTCDNIDAENPLIVGTIGEGRINTAAALGLDVPPDPPTNVQAFDTLGDEGGSITVTWSVPRQDDQDVLGYNVLRAPENPGVPHTPGGFTQIAQLPPGSSFYIDAPVSDHTPYWYQIVVFDAANSVPSSVAGPAEARDDLPPEQITNLVAADTQADQGGSISLSWYGYDFPDDLAEYRVYRGTGSFTDVADMEPLATTDPAEGQHYVDDTTEDGTQYWYAVTAVDDEDNEDTEVIPAGPVVSNPNFSFNYPPGLSIIAVGAVPAAPDSNKIADILGIGPDDAIDLAAWDATSNGGAYVLWSEAPGNALFTQALGRAWWLRSDRPILVNISGEAAPAEDFELPVPAGWSLWGNPYTVRLDFGATEVTGIGQGTPVSLETSNQLGYARDYAWSYDPFTNSYRLITGANLPFATQFIQPGRGVFFMARRPATLVLKRQVVAAAAEREPEPLDGWALQLVAEAAGAADVDNYVGVSARAAEVSGIVSPPRPDADLDLYFVRPTAAGARLATDFVTTAAEATWKVRVACATPGATVRLSWPDLSRLPADCRPVLVDEDTGRTIYLRTSTGYSYEVGDEPVERNFTLRIGDAGDALAIVAPGAIGGVGTAQVVYTLTDDAAVTVDVLNIAGRVVQSLAVGREQLAGPQQLVWDGRSSAGTAAPAGNYLVRIVARGADGQQVSAVRALQLER